MANRTYIAPLDGMRALAILGVLLFHIDASVLPGGFVGVDVFFVISGYIISRNILVDRRSDSFSLLDFYRRRVARLLPAVLATVAVSLTSALYLYPTETVSYFARTGLYSTVSVVNVFFYFNTGYFDPAAEGNIFLHMWSLSVEEQFYLFWPVFLLLFFRIGGNLAVNLGLLAIVTTIASWALFQVDPTAAFFMMPARIFQFAAGAAIAGLHLHHSHNTEGGSSSVFMIGVAMIVASMVMSDGDNYNFVVAAILPTIGSVLAIWNITAPFAQVSSGNSIATYIGRRAYPIYLVHWPLIVMSSLYFGHNRPLEINGALFVASMILGEALHRTVEQPFRMTSKTSSTSKFNQIRLASVFGGLLATVIFTAHLWAHSPNTATQVAEATKTTESYAKFVRDNTALRRELGRYSDGCTINRVVGYEAYNYEACMKGDGDPKVLIIGSSKTGEANIMLSRVLPENSTLLAGTAGCAVTYPNAVQRTRSEGCATLNANRLEWARRDDVVAVAVITQWFWQNEKQIASLLEHLRDTGKPIIVFGARPSMTTEVPTLIDSVAGRFAAEDLTPYIRHDVKKKSAEIQRIIEPFGEQFLYIDQEALLCPERCTPFTEKGTPIYVDTGHATAPALLEFAEKIEKRYGDRIRIMTGISKSSGN